MMHPHLIWEHKTYVSIIRVLFSFATYIPPYEEILPIALELLSVVRSYILGFFFLGRIK